MKILYILGMSSLFFFSKNASAQPLTIQWQKCLGGTMGEAGYSIRQTSDGGFIACGEAISNDGNVSGNHSNQQDGWVVKLDNIGSFVWQRCYGGSNGETFYSIQLLNDDGFILAGQANSNDGDVIGMIAPSDYWIVKCDSVGGLIWQNCLGGTDEEIPNRIIRTYDGGYAVIGAANSLDSDVVGIHDTSACTCFDVWFVKLDSVGSIEWSKCYGSTYMDWGYSVVQTADSGFAFVGSAQYDNGDVQGIHGFNGQGLPDYWVVKINASGIIQWQKCLGGTGEEDVSDIICTNDGGFLITGITESNDFDVSGNHGLYDVWLVKLDSVGNLEWQKCLGGSGDDNSRQTIQLQDSGYLALCYTDSQDGDLSANPPNFIDVWIVRLDAYGNILWQQCLGGSSIDGAYGMQLTSDGGLVFTGLTTSNDGDVSGNHGNYDMWVVKLGQLPDAIKPTLNAISDFAIYADQNNKLHLSYISNAKENTKIQLFDITGRLLMEKSLLTVAGINKIEIPTCVLNKGIYFSRLINEVGSISKKVLLQ